MYCMFSGYSVYMLCMLHPVGATLCVVRAYLCCTL